MAMRSSKADEAPTKGLVVVVEDDLELRNALERLFRSVGLQTVLYASAIELDQAKLPDTPCCLVLDVRLPGSSGLDIQQDLLSRGIAVPLVFMTGYGDIPMSVRAMKSGAVDFLTKPFRDQDMLDAVTAALRHDRERRDAESAKDNIRRRDVTLTPRESEVMTHVTAGLMNKQIAGELGLSEITVKIHRGKVMRKMAARSLADLVKMAELLSAGSSQ